MLRIVRRSRAARAPRVTVTLMFALLSIALVGAGCGSSSPRVSARAGAITKSATQPLPTAGEEAPPESHAELAYQSRVRELCAEVHGLASLSPRGEDAQETGKEVQLDLETLERVRTQLDRLKVLPSLRAERHSYLEMLDSELLLDRRIAADGGEGSSLRAAMEQHEDNSQQRTEIAGRLGIRCLVQREPT